MSARSVEDGERPFALGMQFVLLRTLGKSCSTKISQKPQCFQKVCDVCLKFNIKVLKFHKYATNDLTNSIRNLKLIASENVVTENVFKIFIFIIDILE